MADILYEEFKNYDVLCIEHDSSIKTTIIKTLKEYFNNVYEAHDYESAYEIYVDYKPHIILSDVQVMRNTSLKMIEKIRKNDSSTLIIVTNADYDKNFLTGLINLQINHYMFKAADPQNLLLSIKKAFGNKLYENINFTPELYFDMKKRELIYKDDIVSLRKRDKDFLLLLQKNKNFTTTYSQIEEELWADKEMSKNALKTFINEFRHKLPINLIDNIQQEGYKLKSF